LREILASYILGFIVGALSFRNMRSKFAPAKQAGIKFCNGEVTLAASGVLFGANFDPLVPFGINNLCANRRRDLAPNDSPCPPSAL
jgi:hypothetical protein